MAVKNIAFHIIKPTINPGQNYIDTSLRKTSHVIHTHQTMLMA